MRRFAERVIRPYIAASGYRRLCEIGAAVGENIDRVVRLPDVHITSIDPSVMADLERKYAGHPRVHVHKGLSLEILPTLTEPFDCIMIDGDHNWYTVYHELTIIQHRDLLARNGTILLHDVGWPYGRRDMYYAPETIPAEFRQPMARQGIVRGESTLSTSGGINASQWNATHEHGPRNGVLTAVDDFRREHRVFRYFAFEEEWGLGVLVREGENAQAVRRLERKAQIYNAAHRLRMLAKRVLRRGRAS